MMTKDELADRADRIRRLDEESRTTTVRECELISEMGRILKDTKEKMGYGQWLPWVRSQLTISKITARRYMRIAANESALIHFFPLGKNAIYALLRVKYLTPATVVNGKKVSDLTPGELEAAFRALQGPQSTGPSVLTQAMGHVAGLEKIQKTDPEVWERILEEVRGLAAAPEPAGPRIARLVSEIRQALSSEIPPDLRQMLQDLAREIFRRYGIAA